MFDKNEVMKIASGMWRHILTSLTHIDDKVFNKKHQPCPLCGGNDRFRWIDKEGDGFSLCNQCGSRDGFNLYLELVGFDFVDGLAEVGKFLNCIPTEKRELINKEVAASSTFPKWYKYDYEAYMQLKDNAQFGLSPWQRVSGLNMLDILSSDDLALVPLLCTNLNPCDFVTIDVNGQWQTTQGNKTIPPGFCSVFGDELGQRIYIASNPYHAAHAAVFTQKQVICCYEHENIRHVVSNFTGKERVDTSTPEGIAKAIENMQREEVETGMEIVIIVASIDDVAEADLLKLKQMTFNARNNTINRRLYNPSEIMTERNNRGK